LPSHAVLYIVVLNVHLKVQLSEYLVTTVLDWKSSSTHTHNI